MLRLYNTLTRRKDIFKPLKEKGVGLYACGPTVYDFAHIGNLRTYVFEDILKRVLEYNGYLVRHIMNITDVGHLTSDSDSGEDKMVKALKREGKKLSEQSMLEIADFYTEAFKNDLKRLNIKEPDIWCKATDHIQEQIDLVEKLVENGYAYETESAIYFDTLKLKGYEKLARLDLERLKEGASAEKRVDKRNPTDFALWLKLKGEHKNHIMNWDSPWGKGFPGWHIECSAMSIKYLGEEFDIHCGGIDHIPVHHTNERAQNIGAFGHAVVKIWMHGEFLVLKKSRMGKSEGNIIVLQNLIKQGFNPLAYRYLCLGAHYRSQLTFSLKALEGAQNSLEKLYKGVKEFKVQNSELKTISQSLRLKDNYCAKFVECINNDLNIPQALAVMWELIKDENVKDKEKYRLLLDFDRVFGLDLDRVERIKISGKVQELIERRESLRKKGDFEKADEVRKKIEKLGYRVEDTEQGPRIEKL